MLSRQHHFPFFQNLFYDMLIVDVEGKKQAKLQLLPQLLSMEIKVFKFTYVINNFLAHTVNSCLKSFSVIVVIIVRIAFLFRENKENTDSFQ